jgi:hypothetical protein
MKRLIAAVMFLVLAAGAQAREVDGVAVPETLALAGGKAPLALNGAGLRARFLVKVYVAALYLEQRDTQPERILDSSATRVMAIHMRRDTDSEQIATAFLTSVAKNHDPSEMQALQSRLKQFSLMMPSMKRDDVLRLEFSTGGETRVVLNSVLQGTLQGADFQRALLRIWLGHKPVDDGLKRVLLGVRS